MSGSCLVIGGGPAGAATALYLARAGVAVTVLEARVGAKTKACGEGLMPAGVDVLRDLGLFEGALARGARPFCGIRYRTPAGTTASARFPGWQRGVHGLALRRAQLDALLRDALIAERGVSLREGWAVRGVLADARVRGVVAVERATGRTVELEADLTVAADGVGSRLHALPGVDARRPARRRHGCSAHVAGVAGLGELVEVHLASGGEIYVTPVGSDEANVALVVEDARRAALRPREFLATIRAASAELDERCARARVVDRVLVRGPLGLTVRRTSGPGWTLAGDAAGALDPITGEGLALALTTARALGDAVKRRGALDLEACDAAHRARGEAARALGLLTSTVLFLAGSPALSEAAVRVARAFPSVFARLLGVAAGSGPAKEIDAR